MISNWVDAEIHELERQYKSCNELDDEKLIKILVMLLGIIVFFGGA